MGNKPQKRLLILRPDNIGDVVLFSGVFRQIRLLYPAHHITVAVQPHVVNLIEICPYVDNVIPITNLFKWKKLEKSWLYHFYLYRRITKNVERIKNKIFPQYDLVICPVRSPETAHLEIVFNLSVKSTIGVAGCPVNQPEGGYPSHLTPCRLFSSCLDITRMDKWQHELVFNLQFLKYLGCEIQSIGDVKPEVWLSEFDRSFATENVKPGLNQVIGIFPGASHVIRSWSVENYGPLAELINGNPTYVIFGAKEDIPLANQVAKQLEETGRSPSIVNLAGKTNLRQLFSCISLCDVLISMESSGLHMGIAAGISTVGIAGGGHYGRFVPWGDPQKNVVISQKMNCFHCNWKCKYDVALCVQAVTAEQVAEAVNKFLKA